jgi:hypothetical protein
MIFGSLQIGEFDISVNKKCCIAQLLQNGCAAHKSYTHRHFTGASKPDRVRHGGLSHFVYLGERLDNHHKP